MNIRLDGKRALVTGGSSGIGAAISLALAEAGAKVALNGSHHVEEAQGVVDQIKQGGGDAQAMMADISSLPAVTALFQEIDRAWGGLDLLVNCAGIDGPHAMAWEADPDAWRRVLEINLFGTFYCAREALRRMVPQRGGVVLSLTSVHEEIAWSGYSAYTASKAGVSMMTKTLAQEAAPFGVRVLAVAPGAIKTPINASVWKDPQGLKDLLTKIPLGRMGEPKDIAQVVTFLLSDAGGYVTARTVFVDGGMTDYPEFAHGG